MDDLTTSPAPPGVSLRGATESDYDAIVALWSATGLPYRGDTRDSRAAVAAQLARFGALYQVATLDGRIVGVVFGTHDERKGWINRLAVHPDCRRRGVAARLTQACEAAFAARGIGIVAALVEPENAVSCALFEKLGYRTDAPVRYYRKLSRPDA